MPSIPLSGYRRVPPIPGLCAFPLAWLVLFGYMLTHGWYVLGYLPAYGDASDPYALGLDPLGLLLLLVSMGTMTSFLAVVYVLLDTLFGKRVWRTKADVLGLVANVVLLLCIVAIRLGMPRQIEWIFD